MSDGLQPYAVKVKSRCHAVIDVNATPSTLASLNRRQCLDSVWHLWPKTAALLYFCPSEKWCCQTKFCELKLLQHRMQPPLHFHTLVAPLICRANGIASSTPTFKKMSPLFVSFVLQNSFILTALLNIFFPLSQQSPSPQESIIMFSAHFLSLARATSYIKDS